MISLSFIMILMLWKYKLENNFLQSFVFLKMITLLSFRAFFQYYINFRWCSIHFKDVFGCLLYLEIYYFI